MRNVLVLCFASFLGMSSCQVKESEDALPKEVSQYFKEEVTYKLIYSESDQYTIKVDMIEDGALRFTAWNKPNAVEEEPDVILYNGDLEPQGSGGGAHYIFQDENTKYVVENNLMGEDPESVGIFLRLFQNDKQTTYSRMTNLFRANENDLESYSKKDLIGKWWTPHYAVRKANFLDNGTVEFKPGDGKKITCKFKFSDNQVFIDIEPGKQKVLTLGGGKNNTSLTLFGDGENFVKEYAE